jgi:hypothetical protein
LWLEQKCETDTEFKKKFKLVLETSSSLLKELNLSQGLSTKAVNRLKIRAEQQLEAFLVPQRNYSQWKTRFDSSVNLVTSKPLGTATKTLPPKRFIGIGYRDKGTAKNTATDASPSWQEVAQSNLAKRKNEIERLLHEAKTERDIPRRLQYLRQILKLQEEFVEEHRS